MSSEKMFLLITIGLFVAFTISKWITDSRHFVFLGIDPLGKRARCFTNADCKVEEFCEGFFLRRCR